MHWNWELGVKILKYPFPPSGWGVGLTVDLQAARERRRRPGTAADGYVVPTGRARKCPAGRPSSRPSKGVYPLMHMCYDIFPV